MGFSIAVRQALLDHFFNKAVYTADTSFYFGISSTEPSTTGTNITEPTDIAYARQVILPASFSTASAADPSIIQNTSLVEFAEAQADWFAGALISYGVLYSSTGVFIARGTLVTPKAVVLGDQLRFSAGKLRFGLS